MYQSLLHTRISSRKSTMQAARSIVSSLFLLAVTWPLVPMAHAQFCASIQGITTDPSVAFIPCVTHTSTGQ
jgi:hypothetical protein